MTVAPSADTSSLWFYADASNQPQGPVFLDELKRLATAGTITPETYIIEENGTEWKRFSAIVEPPEMPPPLPRAKQPATGAAKPLTDKASSAGCCGIIAGILLSCTGVGAIIGVPLIIWILIKMGKAQKEGTKTPISGKKLYGKAPGKRTPDWLTALIIIVSSVIIICGLVITATHDMDLTAESAQTFSTPSERVREMMQDIFRNDLRDVSVTDATQDTMTEGRKCFTVLVHFNAVGGWSDKSQGEYIETQMARAYKALYTSDINITNAGMIAHHKMQDSFGNESDGVVYKTVLDRDTARQVVWDKADYLDFTRIWKTHTKYRGFK